MYLSPTSRLEILRIAALLGLLSCVLLISGSTARADQGESTQDVTKTLSPIDGEIGRDPVPIEAFQPHYLMGNNLSEIWDYRVWFPNGYLLNCRFMITSFGPGERTGLVLAYIVPPEGDTIVIKNSRKWGDWKDLTDQSGPRFKIAKNSLGVDLPDHQLFIENEKGTIALDMVSTVEPIRPGRVLYSKEEWYDVTLYAPRLNASGEVKLPNQPAISLTQGRGIATHIVSNVPDNKQSVSVFRFDSFDAATEISMYQLTLQENHGFDRVGYLTVFQDDQVVLRETDFDRQFSELKPDANYKDYLVPQNFTLHHESASARLQGQGDLRFHTRRPQEILDLVNSKVLRFVLKKVAPNPVLYQDFSTYTFDLSLSSVNLESAMTEAEGAEPNITNISGQGFTSLYLTRKPPNDF